MELRTANRKKVAKSRAQAKEDKDAPEMLDSSEVDWGEYYAKLAFYFPRYTFDELLDMPTPLAKLLYVQSMYYDAMDHWKVRYMATASLAGFGGKVV